MDHYTVKRLALILEVQAKIEGMKAKNAYHLAENWSPYYSEKDFEDKSLELSNLAHAHDEQL